MAANSYAKKYTDKEPGRYTAARLHDPQRNRLASFIQRHSSKTLHDNKTQVKERKELSHDSDDLSTSLKELDSRLNSLRAEHSQTERASSRGLSRTQRSTTPTPGLQKIRELPQAKHREVSPAAIKGSNSQTSFAKKGSQEEGFDLLSKSLDQRKRTLDDLERRLAAKVAEVAAKEKQVEHREKSLSAYPSVSEMQQFALSLRAKEAELEERERSLAEQESADKVKRKLYLESDELMLAEPPLSPRFQDSSKYEDLKEMEEKLYNTAKEIEDRTDVLLKAERDLKGREDNFRQRFLTLDQKGRELAKFAEMFKQKEQVQDKPIGPEVCRSIVEDLVLSSMHQSLQRREADLEAREKANQMAGQRLTQEFENLKLVKAKLEGEAKRQQEVLLRSGSGKELGDLLSKREAALKQKEQAYADKLKLLMRRNDDVETRERALRREELSALSLNSGEYDAEKAQALELKEADLERREEQIRKIELRARKNEEELSDLRRKLHSREETIHSLMQKLETSLKPTRGSSEWSLVDIESIQLDDPGSINESHKFSQHYIEKAHQIEQGKLSVEEMLLEMDSSDKYDSFEAESLKKQRSKLTELSLDLE
jgi:hypothetical protein